MTIDLEMLEDFFGDDHHEIRRVFDLFFNSAHLQIQRLHIGLDREDRDILNDAAHQLGGAASTCGLPALSEHLRKLESLSKTETMEMLDNAVKTSEVLVNEAKKEARVRLDWQSGEDAGW